MMTVYLRSLSGYDAEIVSEASILATKKGGAWPPSAPEFYELCGQVAARRFQREAIAKLPAPVEQYSDEHREAMKARFAELLEEFQTGKLRRNKHGFTDEQLEDENCIVNRVGKTPYTMRPVRPYGYLTAAEAALPRMKMPVIRTKPPSWLETWERMNGRKYCGLMRDAAE